jgi:hypothetical protein
VLTTFTSYGAVAPHRQAELIKGLEGRKVGGAPIKSGLIERLEAMMAAVKQDEQV